MNHRIIFSRNLGYTMILASWLFMGRLVGIFKVLSTIIRYTGALKVCSLFTHLNNRTMLIYYSLLYDVVKPFHFGLLLNMAEFGFANTFSECFNFPASTSFFRTSDQLNFDQLLRTSTTVSRYVRKRRLTVSLASIHKLESRACHLDFNNIRVNTYKLGMFTNFAIRS